MSIEDFLKFLSENVAH